ncbi:MAG: 16S rRNA (cytosine(1402)-N(4))-methyltransferase, partial [Acidocella sp.]
MTEFSHIPVLRDEAVTMLQPRDGGVYLDGTFGGGGYAKAILDAADCRLFAVDRDPAAVARGRELEREYPGRFEICEGRISNISELLAEREVFALDGAVFDLGVSSYQIDDPARGFSFRHDGPLNMQIGSSEMNAETLVNFCPESELFRNGTHWPRRPARSVPREGSSPRSWRHHS